MHAAPPDHKIRDVALLKLLAQYGGLACQLWGFGQLLRRAWQAKRLLRDGAQNRVDGGDAAGSHYDPDLSDVALLYLKDAAGSVLALVIILLGILLAFLSSLL